MMKHKKYAPKILFLALLVSVTHIYPSELNYFLYNRELHYHEKNSMLGWAGLFIFRRNGTLVENKGTGEGAYAVTGKFKVSGTAVTIHFRFYSTYETDSCVNGKPPRPLAECLKRTREKHDWQDIKCKFKRTKTHPKYTRILQCDNGYYMANPADLQPIPTAAIFESIPINTEFKSYTTISECEALSTIIDGKVGHDMVANDNPLPVGTSVLVVGRTGEPHKYKGIYGKWALVQIQREPAPREALWIQTSCIGSP